MIQINVTRACDKACFGCTQGSNLAGKATFMQPGQFRDAVESLRGYFGVVGLFGGNPAVSPFFGDYCRILRESWVPKEQRGIWCNNPMSVENARVMRETFNPRYSNLNVHLDRDAYAMFKEGWPECHPVGLDTDSRHSPPFVAMRDVLGHPCRGCQYCNAHGDAWKYDEECDGSGFIYDEAKGWELIANCDINQQWSAMIGLFRGQLRAWFCEVAGAQSILHQDEPDYPDTGLDPTTEYLITGKPFPYEDSKVVHITPEGPYHWWELRMPAFADQVRKHCHECGIPLRGHGELAQADDAGAREQVTYTHQDIYRPKRKGRAVELVMAREQLGKPLDTVTKYLQNSSK